MLTAAFALLATSSLLEFQPAPFDGQAWLRTVARTKPSVAESVVSLAHTFPVDGASHRHSSWIDNYRMAPATSTCPEPLRAVLLQGPAVVPFLVSHLGDPRHFGNSLAVGLPGYPAWQDCEVDANKYENSTTNAGRASAAGSMKSVESYQPTVGDLCYLLLGLIINRGNYLLSRGESMYADVGAPSVCPEKVRLLKNRWGGLTRESIIESLVRDVLTPDSSSRLEGAIRRLKLYAPNRLRTVVLGKLKLQHANIGYGDDVYDNIGRRDTAFTTLFESQISVFACYGLASHEIDNWCAAWVKGELNGRQMSEDDDSMAITCLLRLKDQKDERWKTLGQEFVQTRKSAPGHHPDISNFGTVLKGELASKGRRVAK